MNLEQLAAAKGNPAAQALVALEIALTDEPAALERAIEAAAVPRWFNKEILTSMLGEDMQSQAADLFDQVIRMACVEPYLARKESFNVHETTRLALRERLYSQSRERFLELSQRATQAFENSNVVADRIEHVYHRIVWDPEGAADEIRELDFEFQQQPEDALSLTGAFGEYLKSDVWPAQARSWAYGLSAWNRRDYQSAEATLNDAQAALAEFEAAGDTWRTALAQRTLADALTGVTQSTSPAAGSTAPLNAAELYDLARKTLEGLLEKTPNHRVLLFDVTKALHRQAEHLRQLGRFNEDVNPISVIERSLVTAQRLYDQHSGLPQATRMLVLSHWYAGDYYFHCARKGGQETGLRHLEQALELAREQLQAFPNSAFAIQDIGYVLRLYAKCLESHANQNEIKRAGEFLQESSKHTFEFYEKNKDSSEAARGHLYSLAELGKYLLLSGRARDAARARNGFDESLKIAKHLYEHDTRSVRVVHAYSDALINAGDFYRDHGNDGDEARVFDCYQWALKADQELYDLNSESSTAARNVRRSVLRMADFYQSRAGEGDLPKALELFEQCVSIARKLYDDNPDSGQLAQELSSSLTKLGDFYMRRNTPDNFAAALHYFEEAEAICQRLYDDNPDSAQASRDLSVCLAHLGAFYTARKEAGDSETALGYFQKSLFFAERSYDDNPENAAAAQEYSDSLDKLAGFYLVRHQGDDHDSAIKLLDESLVIREKLRGDNPDSTRLVIGVVDSLERLANAHAIEDMEEALDFQSSAATLTSEQFSKNTGSFKWGLKAAQTNFHLAKLAEGAGRNEQAKTAFAETLRVLDVMKKGGMQFDAWMTETYEKLAGRAP